MQIEENLIPAEIVNVFNSLIIDVKLKNGSVVPVFCPSSEVARFAAKGSAVMLKALKKILNALNMRLNFWSRTAH